MPSIPDGPIAYQIVNGPDENRKVKIQFTGFPDRLRDSGLIYVGNKYRFRSDQEPEFRASDYKGPTLYLPGEIHSCDSHIVTVPIDILFELEEAIVETQHRGITVTTIAGDVLEITLSSKYLQIGSNYVPLTDVIYAVEEYHQFRETLDRGRNAPSGDFRITRSVTDPIIHFGCVSLDFSQVEKVVGYLSDNNVI